ncbi:hypothetical protein [Urbifossiella limnaea]|uniref:Uncharacterized protein n=1 Tax=Urbifossiella limnaea TaxID=2528023 RepID=A0A517Y0I0_9BACT|nr:hypothetical protein [Urbifossiella limnaea]QDU23263.1 hypothetical protein ETAA1_52570 [Urbifossiella limnaea]
MSKPRYFLLLAVGILALGCFIIIRREDVKPEECSQYLGMTCIVLAICVAALIEALQAVHKRVEELERKLAGK